MTITEKTSEKFDDLTAQTGNTGIAFAAIFTDDNKKYLSTDLMYETNVSADHWAYEVELIGMRAIR